MAKKTIQDLAFEVIFGKWGSGKERRRRLEKAGYNYDKVQARVNDILTKKSVDTVAHEVIKGKWGSGETRKKRLEKVGYNYKAVQNRVNEILADDTETKIANAAKAQTEWAYKSTYKWQPKPTVSKSKTKGTCVTYVACVFQRIGALKSGQYIWHDGSGFGKGKVYGATDNFIVTYRNNKALKDIKDLRAGDIVMYDDNKSGESGNGGHIEIFNGKIKDGKYYFYSGGVGSGHNTTNNNKEKSTRKVLATCRVKDGVIR